VPSASEADEYFCIDSNGVYAVLCVCEGVRFFFIKDKAAEKINARI